MKYENIKNGIFVSRPNRFIANVIINGKEEVCHVKNTGRCKELLIPGCEVILEESKNPLRKTKYDLIAVYKDKRLINIDSLAPNKVFGEWADKYFKNVSLIKSEVKFGNSRFDFYIEADGKRIFAEVKGVTLEKDGVVLFPDAPTQRGLKHINELCEAVKQGYGAYIFFIVQMDNVKYFTPNKETHKAFADALKKAKKKGVKIKCFNCIVNEDELFIKNEVKVKL
ncbi:MAG: DNA/RNA nuclease SfsA [Clostridia bacterium]|nr:DNA/RNA nuclease SfsA [Clostridia bacterium]MBO7289633.1 DNA/RNA nuclease SfsA [Clostridia bacterium]